MAKIRRVVRKVAPPGSRYFDEQLWPICIALVVLGCFLMGMSVAYQPLSGAAWYATAWPSLIGIPLAVAGCMAALLYFDSRLVRRSLQLSIVLCAILHVAFVVQMIETRIFSGAFKRSEARVEIIERRPPKIVPEYHPTQLVPEEDRPRQDFEKPVETQTTEPTRQRQQIVRQPTEEERSPPDPQPVPLPEQVQTVEPNVVSRPMPNEVAPHLAAQASRLSRQVKESESRTSQLVETPQPVRQPPAGSEARPSASPVTRQQTEPTATALAPAEPAATAESRGAQLGRRTSERSPTAEPSAAPAVPRAAPQLTEARRTPIAAAAPPPKQDVPEEIKPASTSASRRAAASAEMVQRAAEATLEARRDPTARPQRRETSTGDQPAIAASSGPMPQRRPRVIERSDVATGAEVLATKIDSAAKNASVAEVTPRAAAFERTAAEATDQREPAGREPQADGREQPTAAIARRAGSENSVATLQPHVDPGSTPRRAVAAAATTSSAVPMESPAAAVATTGAVDPAAQPARLALSRGQAGITGAGRSPNVDSSLPGNAGPALVASGAARRAEATQRNPAGDALTPSAPAQLARSRAGANVPTLALKAESALTATAAGAQQVAEITASSSAALVRSDAAARNDAVTAGKGSGEADLGPTQVVAEAGIGRASGGGQPELNFQTPSPQPARRSTAGGAPLMALATAEVGDVAAPAGTSGGALTSAELAPAQFVTAVNKSAGHAATNAGLPVTTGPGPLPEIATAAFLAELPPNRADSGDAPAQASSSFASSGRETLPRKVAGPVVATAAAAEQVVLAESPTAGSAAGPAPLEARGLAPLRAEVRPMGTAIDSTGAALGREITDSPPVGLAGDAARHALRGGAPRQATDGGGPAIGDVAIVGAPAKRANVNAIVSGATSVAEIPEVGPMSAVAQAEVDHLLGGVGKAPTSRQRGDALAVDIQAPAGPGGLGSDFTPEVGINTRQARADSLHVELRSARFLRSQVGGLPAVSTAAIVASDAFASRAARVRGDTPAGGRGTPAPQTEEAIERGLAFLARYQGPDGGWSLQGFPEGAQLASDTAATALAVIALQGAGYNHREFQYKDVVRGGIDYLLKSQKENGDLFVPLDDASNQSVWLYSHSLAAIALCEAYGMTQDPALRQPAQRAIDFIVAGQHAQRGGWRYAPGISTDTSVTGWMMMALKSGELAGLKVPQASYAGINGWLDDAQQSPAEPHLYRYNPYAPDTEEQRHGRAPGKTMTAVGLLMRLYTGWKRDNPNMIRGAEFLAGNLPAQGTVREPLRDTYYWYYATQVMAHMGGDWWQAWNNRLHPLLVNSQIRQGPYAGSWDPRVPIADRWGPHAGRLYVTTMNLLSLEVQYRKLPLYEDAIK